MLANDLPMQVTFVARPEVGSRDRYDYFRNAVAFYAVLSQQMCSEARRMRGSPPRALHTEDATRFDCYFRSQEGSSTEGVPSDLTGFNFRLASIRSWLLRAMTPTDANNTEARKAMIAKT